MTRLPGGLWEGGAREREFAFRPVTGALELALAEAGEADEPLPAAVTRILALALRSIGEKPADSRRVAGLCAEDRRFLMRRLRMLLGRGRGWRHETCKACGRPFDFFLDAAELPVQEAPGGYPFAEVGLGGTMQRFRLPVGSDLDAVGGCADEEEAEWLLLRRCWLPRAKSPGAEEKAWGRFRGMGDKAKAAAEAALEAVSPGITTGILAACPECHETNEVEVDDYALAGADLEGILGEVHELASSYHWSQSEILELSRSRRQRYLGLIDGVRGMAG